MMEAALLRKCLYNEQLLKVRGGLLLPLRPRPYSRTKRMSSPLTRPPATPLADQAHVSGPQRRGSGIRRGSSCSSSDNNSVGRRQHHRHRCCCHYPLAAFCPSAAPSEPAAAGGCSVGVVDSVFGAGHCGQPQQQQQVRSGEVGGIRIYVQINVTIRRSM